MNMDPSTQLLPQGLDITDSPTFVGLTLTGLTENRMLYAGAGGKISNTANMTVSGNNFLISSTNQLQFGDSGTYINQGADGHLDLTADASVDINSPITYISGDLGIGIDAPVTGLQVVGTGFNGPFITLGKKPDSPTSTFGGIQAAPYDGSEPYISMFTFSGDVSNTNLNFGFGVGTINPTEIRFYTSPTVTSTSPIKMLELASANTINFNPDTEDVDTIFYGDTSEVMRIDAQFDILHFPDQKYAGFGTNYDVLLGFDSGNARGVMNLTTVANVGFEFDSTGGSFTLDGTTGNWLLGSSNQLQFGDSGTYINQGTDGHIDIIADVSIDLNNKLFIEADGDTYWDGDGSGLPYGSLYIHEGASNVDISTPGQGVYVKITGFTTGNVNLVTINSDAFNVDKIGVYKIFWQISGDSQGNNKDYEIDIFVNGVEQSDGSSRREFGALGSLGSMSGSCICDITNTGHDIDVRMKEIGAGAGTDFDIFNMNFNIVMVGGT